MCRLWRSAPWRCATTRGFQGVVKLRRGLSAKVMDRTKTMEHVYRDFLNWTRVIKRKVRGQKKSEWWAGSQSARLRDDFGLSKCHLTFGVRLPRLDLWLR